MPGYFYSTSSCGTGYHLDEVFFCEKRRVPPVMLSLSDAIPVTGDELVGGAVQRAVDRVGVGRPAHTGDWCHVVVPPVQRDHATIGFDSVVEVAGIPARQQRDGVQRE